MGQHNFLHVILLLQLHVFVLSGEILSSVLRVVGEARQRMLGPFSPSFSIHDLLLEGLEKVMWLHESIMCTCEDTESRNFKFFCRHMINSISDSSTVHWRKTEYSVLSD
jgi:hypothetical protein